MPARFRYSEFTDQRPYLLAAARAGAILGGEALVKVRDFIVGSRHVGGFLRSRVERFPHVAALRAQPARAEGTRRRDARCAGRRRHTPRRREPRAEASAQPAARRARRTRSAPAALAQRVGHGVVRLRLHRDDSQSPLRAADEAELLGAVRGNRAGPQRFRRNAVRRADVGGRAEQPADDARARGRGGRNANPRAADRDGRRIRAGTAAHVRRDGRARRAQRARAFRRALSMRRAAAGRRGNRFYRRAASAADDQRPRRDSDRRENRRRSARASSSRGRTPAAKPSRSRPSGCCR